MCQCSTDFSKRQWRSNQGLICGSLSLAAINAGIAGCATGLALSTPGEWTTTAGCAIIYSDWMLHKIANELLSM